MATVRASTTTVPVLNSHILVFTTINITTTAIVTILILTCGSILKLLMPMCEAEGVPGATETEQ